MITSPSPPYSTAEQLETITSDNEIDNNEEKYDSFKPTQRVASPHPTITNRIIHDRKNFVKN